MKREPLVVALKKKGKLVQNHDEYCANNQERLLGMRDAIEVLSGKWKIQLIGTLLFKGKRRFMDLLRDVDGIAAKMLSKELQDLKCTSS